MIVLISPLLLLLLLLLATSSVAVEPEAVYGGRGSGNSSSTLRLGNGDKEKTALSNAYIEHQAKTKGQTLQVAWYKSDTTQSIKLLQSNDVDVCITYNKAAEDMAVKEGIAMSPSYYAFNDHFLLVGPKSNPAKVDEDSPDALAAFAKINMEAEKSGGDPPVRFLSRYDKSATNIKESLLFASIGQVPWTDDNSTLYQRFEAFPIQALTMAMDMDAYTLTDKGTLLSVNETVRNQVVVYSKGTDDEDDVLLNPAHLLIGAQGNQEMAKSFAEWLIDEKGQSVIADFEKNGEKLYTRAPSEKKKKKKKKRSR
ncbi:hypothetical protein L249_2867 [Ophiocordyceps polyrhachis-furcata BCC 54312]|uniref:PBP domain-containing protein n=1 Tax=Ophiocordyceps polyrhachis-furcata BCC 54312 TaxID=1330021 RepID=A0A367LQ88_9HYPO|nr:hypothetical protein L249_2867 [Ophiocordyceps polyrhachis-furcata BCC 54312]